MKGKTAKKKVVKKKVVKNPSKYYSVYFEVDDVNYAREIQVLTHENGIDLSRAQIEKLPNHFYKKTDANRAKRLIWNALKS